MDGDENKKKKSRKSSAYHIAKAAVLKEGKTLDEAKELGKAVPMVLNSLKIFYDLRSIPINQCYSPECSLRSIPMYACLIVKGASLDPLSIGCTDPYDPLRSI